MKINGRYKKQVDRYLEIKAEIDELEKEKKEICKAIKAAAEKSGGRDFAGAGNVGLHVSPLTTLKPDQVKVYKTVKAIVDPIESGCFTASIKACRKVLGDDELENLSVIEKKDFGKIIKKDYSI